MNESKLNPGFHHFHKLLVFRITTALPIVGIDDGRAANENRQHAERPVSYHNSIYFSETKVCCVALVLAVFWHW